MNNNGKIKLELTSEEISILSNGLFCLIMNANEDLNGNFRNVNPFICEVAKIKERNYRKAIIF